MASPIQPRLVVDQPVAAQPAIPAQPSLFTDIRDLAHAITQGDLDHRLPTNDYTGDAAAACRDLNQMLDTIFQTYERAVISVEGLVTGNIEPPFQEGFPGGFGRARTACNDVIDVVHRRNTQLAKMTAAAARGDLHVRASTDEFAGANRHIFQGFNAMFDAWLAPVNEIERVLTALARMDLSARVEGQYEGDYQRIATTLNSVCSRFAQEVQRISQHTLVMASASEELSAVTRELTRGASETSRLAHAAVQSSEKVSSGLGAVSGGADEMLQSMREIAHSAGKASTVVQSAVDVSHTTTQTITHLGQSSVEISKVIKLITSIAQQTNLLALNATIEAARAGEAGKGFAVVANEVKELAKGTAKATDQVSQSIATIQQDTRESVEGIGSITTVTGQILEITQTIAAAVEEQTATTNEMGRYIGEVAQTAAAIATEMRELSAAASTTSAGATQTDAAIADLNRILTELQAFVALFKV